MGTLVCTSHTHTKIRRKKCGDLGLKPGGVMWGLYEISLFEKTLVCVSHTHTKIRRKKCGDLGLKPGGVMWGLYEISLFEKTLVSTSHTHTQIRRKKWGPNSSKQVPSTTVQFSHTHYLGPQIAPLTNTND